MNFSALRVLVISLSTVHTASQACGGLERPSIEKRGI